MIDPGPAAAFPVAFKDVDDTYVVVSPIPFNRTCASGLKFDPFKLIEKFPAGTGDGDTLQTHGVGRITVRVASPNLSGYAVLVARTASTLGVGATAGALYNPVAEIVPIVALPPTIPFTDHTTVFGDNGT